MTTPTKIIVDVITGQITEVELSGPELDAYNASLAQQAAEAAEAAKAAEAAAATPAAPATPAGQ